MAWNTPYVLLNCTRGWGKSSIIDALIMAKTMLYPSYGAYIASGTGGQAQQTFQTLINIAQKNINSMASLTDIFSKELEIRNATGDGFIRNPEGYYYNLYNKSFCKTLNSNVDRRRGNRANLVVFDECGWLDANLMNVFGAFTIVNEDAKTGADIDQTVLHSLPLGAPHQLIYISSASQVGTPFYQKYRDF